MAIRQARDADGNTVTFRNYKDANGNEQWTKVDAQDSYVMKILGRASELIEQTPEYIKQKAKEAEFNVGRRKLLKQTAVETSPLEAMFVSSGREFNKLGAGTADIADAGLEQIGSKDATKRMQDRATEQSRLDEQYSYLEKEHPMMTLFGSVLPYIATAPLGVTSKGVQTATHLAAPTNILNSVANIGKIGVREGAIGAAEGAAHYDTSAGEGALWGAGGGLLGNRLGRTMGGASKELSPELQRIVDFAVDNDIFMSPGLRTGDLGLQQMDSALRTHHTTANKMGDLLDRSKRAENRLLSQELGGPPADYMSADYLADQRERITRNMDDLVGNTSGKLDEESAYRATNIIDDYRARNVDQESKAILDKYENLIYKYASEGRELTGQEFQDFTKKLNDTATSQYISSSGDRHLANALSKISNIFNDAMGSGMDPNALSKWKDARRQYALLNEVEKVKDVRGYVDMDKLSQKFKSSDTITKLGEIEKWRKLQKPSSLSTGALMSRMMGGALGGDPTKALSAATLLGGRMTKGIGPLNDMFTSIYLAGFPHVTGIAPIAGRNTERLMERTIPRLGMSEDNGYEDKSPLYEKLMLMTQ